MSAWWDITNIWQIFPALAIGVSILIYYKSRRIKALSYKIVTDEPLLTVGEELHGKIKILYEGAQVEDISLLIIKFINHGNESIKSDDFEEPITISFSPNVGVLSVELINTNPQTINAKIRSDSDKIIIEPLLLNRGDSITIKALLTGSKPACKIASHANLAAYGNARLFNAENDLMLRARIIGVTAIREVTEYITIPLSENYKIKFNKRTAASFLEMFVAAISGVMITALVSNFLK